MKKVVVAAVVVLALALVAWWAQRDGIPSDRATASTTPSELAAPLARPDAERGVAMSPVESAVRTAGLEVGSEPKTATQPFRCRVVDGVTDEPIAGARVRFYAPKSSLYSEVRARWPARFVASSYGETRVHDWPWFRAPPTVEQRCDLDPVLSYEGPRNGDSPAAEATTGADGEVEVALGADQAFVVVEHPDYASRGLPPILERTYNVVGSDGNASKPVFRDDALVVGLYRAQTVRGQLIDLDGKSLAARIELRFDGYESRDRAENGMTLSSAVDSWTVPTNDDGSFTARIAAESFQVRSLDPTRVLARTAMHPERKEQWSFARAYALPTTETIWVPIRAGSSVVVRTAQGDEPVRDYFMQLRDLSTGTGMGIEARVRSDDGRTALFDGDALDSLADGRRYPLAVHVRADGFLSAKAELSDPSMSGEVVIRLERGAGPRLTGRVVDGTRAIAGATILVRAGSPRSWDCEATWASTATRTDADGRFAVDASPGGWVVQAVDGERSTCLYVEHPSSDTLVLDFSTDTAVEFVVDAPPGARFEEMLAFLRGTNNFGKRLDERGRMRFGSLPAGSYMAQLVARGMKVELQPGDDQFELAAGTTRTLNVRVTSIEQTRRARLVVEGTNAPDGWRFQSYDLTKWSAVDADGRFPIDIGVTRATVEDVEGARYSFWFEADAEEPVLRVAQQSGMCTGRIVRKDGTGASGLRVVAAIPRDAGTLVSVTALTGEGGRFELHGLPDSARSLQILDRYEREQIDGFASLTFRCGGPLRGRDVSIELPDDREWSGKAADRVALSGIARRAGAPLVGTTLRVSAFWPQRDGNLTIASDTRTLSDGRYAVTTVRAIQHAASFRVGTDHVREEFTIPEGVGEHVQDFDLP